LRNRMVQKLVRDAIVHIPDTYSPYMPQAQSYAVMKTGSEEEGRCSQGLPIPPASLRMTYGGSKEGYLEHGQADVAKMRAALEAAGHPLSEGQRVLEWGVAGGRLLRWLYDYSDRCEIWGADIDAKYIVWCSQNLTPPFHFVTTGTSAHLPFEDRYFDLIFAGSVFTHVDDFAQAWFLELRRVIKPGGVLYVTIHDKHTIDLLGSSFRDAPLAHRLRADSQASQWATSDFAKFTIGRATDSQVFYDVDHLCKSLEPFYKVLSVEEEAYYGKQTAVMLERQ
jgi:ubiquinone/menaquinone biosynthesis C-methylase UbiE